MEGGEGRKTGEDEEREKCSSIFLARQWGAARQTPSADFTQVTKRLPGYGYISDRHGPGCVCVCVCVSADTDTEYVCVHLCLSFHVENVCV